MKARRKEMRLWTKFWLLFTVLWVVVASLNAMTMFAFGEEIPPERPLTVLASAIVVPAALYAVGWLRDWLHSKRGP